MGEKKCYSYSELETFGLLLLGLPNIFSDNRLDNLSAAEIIHVLVDCAEDFAREWNKLTLEEHGELGEDFIDEVCKFAKWIKGHVCDVFHNHVEYGGYRARRARYRLVYDGSDGEMKDSQTDCCLDTFDTEGEAVKRMFGLVSSMLPRRGSGCEAGIKIPDSQSRDKGEPLSCWISHGGSTSRYKVERFYGEVPEPKGEPKC